MRQVTVHSTISAPREQVFDVLADLGARPAFTDHYLSEYRLARADCHGLGAAACFVIDAPFAKESAGMAIIECDRPRRIVEELHVGRRGRSRAVAVYELAPDPAGNTKVELTTYSEPATAIDRFRQRRVHRWMRRQTKTALERLRQIFEEPPEHPLARATIAGFEPWKGPRFGSHAGVVPGNEEVIEAAAGAK